MNEVEFDLIGPVIDAEVLYQKMSEMLLCPHCQRLWLVYDGLREGVAFIKEQFSQHISIQGRDSKDELREECICGFTIPFTESPNILVRGRAKTN